MNALYEAAQLIERNGWVGQGNALRREADRVLKENEHLKERVSELSAWNEALENGVLAEAKERAQDRRQLQRDSFLAGLEAGKKGNAFRHATEVGREITLKRMAELDEKIKNLRSNLATARSTALKAVQAQAVAEKELHALKAKYSEELRAAKYAAWNAACHEIRAAALVVGGKDHKYILDAMGEFE